MLHKPSGLYYTPVRRVKNLAGKYCKSNLSKWGKLYRKYPSIGWTSFQIYTHLHNNDGDMFIEAGVKDWEIVKHGEPAKSPPTKLEDHVRLAIENCFKQSKCLAGIDSSLHKDLLNDFYDIYTEVRAAEELAKAGFELHGAL